MQVSNRADIHYKAYIDPLLLQTLFLNSLEFGDDYVCACTCAYMPELYVTLSNLAITRVIHDYPCFMEKIGIQIGYLNCLIMVFTFLTSYSLAVERALVCLFQLEQTEDWHSTEQI